MKRMYLKRGREGPLLRRHPWIFSGAIQRLEGHPQPGETVEVLSHEGDFLARGAYSPHSQIQVRAWCFDPDQEIGKAFFLTRIQKALQSSARCHRTAEEACRLIHAESDGLPGVIVDAYAGFLVCQFLSAGGEFWKHAIAEILADQTGCQGIYERSDADVREKEGLPRHSGPLLGTFPPDRIEIREGLIRFLVDVRQGQKTGFYLDQAQNRRLVSEYARDREVLNAFSYTGGFGLWALAAGAAHCVNVESSGPFLEMGRANARLNNLEGTQIEHLNGDVFQVLRKMRDAGRQFDLILLDPPKFAGSERQVLRASRGYKDLHLLAMKLLRPEGILASFSCSMAIGMDLFQKIAADGALDAGRDVQILQRLHQAPDHPTLLSFPEGTYLKGLVSRVM